MATLDQLVQQDVDAKKEQAISDILAKANAERTELDEIQMKLQKQAADLVGYQIGITPAAYKTENANALVRDYTQSVYTTLSQMAAAQDAMPESHGSLFSLAMVIGIVFYFYKKKG